MEKRKKFDLKELKSKWGEETIEIILPRMDKIDPSHIIKITRPDFNEDTVRQVVANKRRERMEWSLFAEAVRAEMEEEITVAIKDEIARIKRLPNPIVFIGKVKEVKYRNMMVVKLEIPKNIAKYFLEYSLKLDEMLIELEQMPLYFDETKKSKRIIEIFEEFDRDIEDVYQDKEHRNPYKILPNNSPKND